MIAALACASLLTLTPAPHDAPEAVPGGLSPELLVNHPALLSGDFEGYRAELLAGLEAEPDSPWAADAAEELATLNQLAPAPLDPARLRELAERTPDARVSQLLRQLVLREARRRRYSSAPYPLGEDLWGEFVRGWHVLGPCGPLEAAVPMAAEPQEHWPERDLRVSLPGADGRELRWTPLERWPQRRTVDVSRSLWPAERGVGYLLAFVRADADQALLELQSTGDFRAFWNGREVLRRTLTNIAQREPRLVAPVALGPGWNALLVRFDNSSPNPLGARLLDASGRALALEEATWPAEGLPAWEPAAGPPLLEVPSLEVPPGTPFAAALAVRRATRAGRCDRALAVPEPADESELPAWLRARRLALQAASHLPGEVGRRLGMEVEGRLAALDLRYPQLEMLRIQRLISEDQLTEALAAVAELRRACPAVALFGQLESVALAQLDPTSGLAHRALGQLAERFPDFAAFQTALAMEANDAGDLAGALERGQRALALDGSDSDLLGMVLGLLESATAEQAERARHLIEEVWLAEEPGDGQALSHLLAHMARRGRFDERAQLLQTRRERLSQSPMPIISQASNSLRGGDPRAARAYFQEALALAPGVTPLHETLAFLDVPSAAEQFFEAFAPDVERALDLAQTAQDASIALALDSALVYVYPDGSWHTRTHSITRALDRRGTELLQEQPASSSPLVARVIDAEGQIFEPVLVEGGWVMPSLDPGDAVEMVYDSFGQGIPGSPPQLGWWRFASFNEPYAYSRYVVFLPESIPGRWEAGGFDGLREEHPWSGGTVHEFSMINQPRRVEEPLRPSDLELLPWVHYGGDYPSRLAADAYRARVAQLASLTADVELELEQFLERIESGAGPIERARAIYAAVTAHVLDFEGGGDTTDVWTMRRGDPTGLLAALYRLDGIEFEWGVLNPPVAPELDPEPVRPFESLDDYGAPILRLAPERDGGQAAWVLFPPGGRGFPFARIPDELAGARVLMLGGEGPRHEVLPRSDLEESWGSDMELTYRLQEDGSAQVQGRLRVTTPEGALLREQIAQAEPQQRSQAARGIAGNAVTGLDLSDWTFVDLEQRGADFVLEFEGHIPGFVEGGGERGTCRTHLEPVRFSGGLGPAERRWPLAMRFGNRARWRVRFEFGEAWSWEFPGESRGEELAGFRFLLGVEREPNALVLERLLEIRGLELEPDQVPGFLQRLELLEQDQERAIEVRRRQ